MKSAKNLSDLFSNKLGNWKKFSLKNLRKDQLLILLLTGILLMVIAVPAGKKKENMSSASNDNTEKSVNGTSAGTDEEAYTAYLEDRLSRTLSQIEGAPSPAVGCPEYIREAKTIPARPAINPENACTKNFTFSTLIPENSAAC